MPLMTSNIIRQLRSIPRIANYSTAADYLGPYNKLLCSIFPWDSDYTVCPRFEPGSYYHSENPRCLFDIEYGDKLVFMMEHRAPHELQCPFERDDVDTALRRRMEELRFKCPCRYFMLSAHLGRWDCDLLEEEGEKRFESMVEEIKQACAAL